MVKMMTLKMLFHGKNNDDDEDDDFENTVSW